MDDQDTSRPKPSSAPAVPKELLSARPAMTKVVPRSPDKVAQASKAMAPAPKPTAEELAERQERIDYLKSLRAKEAKPNRGNGKKWLITLLVLLLLAGLGGAAYWYFSRPVTSQPTATTQESQTPSKTNDTESAAPADLKDFQSQNLPVSLKYPSSWTVSDTTQKLTITSTKQSLTAADGQKISGQVVVTIRPKQASLEEFKAGNASAVLESKKISYSQPAAGQRDSTYISYLQYAKTTTKGALDAIYVTGNSGYQKAQYVPQADVVKVDPLITVSFVSCSGNTCITPASVEASSWSASQLGGTIETLLKSLGLS